MMNAAKMLSDYLNHGLLIAMSVLLNSMTHSAVDIQTTITLANNNDKQVLYD